MSEQEQSQYPSPSKLPSIRDLQSRQKQFNKMSAQRLSSSKTEQQFQEVQIPAVQQPPSSQLSGKKYYQSRYIHSPGQALNYQRSGSKPQERNYELDTSSVQQTPVSQFSTHLRNKSEYQVQQSWEIDPALVDDAQIEQFVEQLLLDEMVAQQLREQKSVKGMQFGKGVKDLVLRLTNQIMVNQGLRQQQSAAFSGQYNALKQDYLKLQSEFSRRVAEQNDRIQRLENECREKDELLIRESKTRQMLEQQNQENTKRLSEVTGEYHNKLQMKEDIFYQKGQECYNEINVLRQLVGELQEKVQIKEHELLSCSDELFRSNERIKALGSERELERNSLQNEIYGLSQKLELMESDEKELAVLVEQLKAELALLENQCAERENHIRVSEEEKKRDIEGYELMLKEKDQQRAFEVNNLLQLAEIQNNKEYELKEKYLMKIGLVEDEIKKVLVFKQDIVSWIYQQKNGILSGFKQIIQKSTESMTKNANWYKKLLKERDTEYNQLVQSQEKEIGNLNERWQEMMQQQEIQLRNEHRSELLQEVGKMEARIVGLQGQINDYQVNYTRIKEESENAQREARHHEEQRDDLLNKICQFDCALEESEWKYEKEVSENKLLSIELLQLQSTQNQTERRLNDVEKRRIATEAKLNCSLYKCDVLERDIKELLNELHAEKNKYEQNEKERRVSKKKELEDQNQIIKLSEEIVQCQYEIRRLKNCIATKEAELEQNAEQKKALNLDIEQQKAIVNQRDSKIRQLELALRDDLANYFETNKQQAELMEGLKLEKQQLGQHIDELDKAHKQEAEDKQKQKIKIIEELHAVIAQLNERNNELRLEKRTVEGLQANKSKLEQIIGNLNQKMEELNLKLLETEQKLKQSENDRESLGTKFNNYKLQQLKLKKSGLLQAKKILAAFKAEYLEHKNSLENIINEQNENLQALRDSIESQLNQLAVQYAQELNNLRVNLDQSHTDYMNQLLNQEKERGRVQTETVRKQLSEQIIQLSEEINNLKKKISNMGGEKQAKGQNLNASEMVKRFSTQQLQDIQTRYLSIKSELDTIVSEAKGKYEAIQELHQQTTYTKEQIAQLKQFTDIQDVLSSLILQSEELLKKYQELDVQRDRDLKASHSMIQSKIISQQKKIEQEIPCQLTDSFSPTQYNQRKQYQQQQQQQLEEKN